MAVEVQKFTWAQKGFVNHSRAWTPTPTAILRFTKDGQTDHVFFYDVQADGFSLDDKRTPASAEVGRLGPKKENDLYDAIERWGKRSPKKEG